MNEEQKTVRLDTYEEGAVIEGLNKIRTEQLERNGAADFVSDLMLKIMHTPTRKARFIPLTKMGTSRGKEEQCSAAHVCRKAGSTAERSLRRRDEAR